MLTSAKYSCLQWSGGNAYVDSLLDCGILCSNSGFYGVIIIYPLQTSYVKHKGFFCLMTPDIQWVSATH